MDLLEFIPSKKSYLFILSFILGLFLALSFEPFNVPFLSVLVIGIYFLVNNYTYKKTKNHFKFFFYNGLFLWFWIFFIKYVLGF